MGRRLLADGRPESVHELGRRLGEIFDAAAQGLGGLLGSKRIAVCAAGCSWCCHLMLIVDAPTVLQVAATVSTWPPLRLAEVKSKIAAYRADNYAVNTVPRPPCPLLVDGKCSVYQIRPLVCRAHNSTDVTPCRLRYGGLDAAIEGELAPLEAKVAVEDGLASALKTLRLDHGFGLEFTTALGIALDDPDATRRWVSGEDIFAPARLPDHILRLYLDQAEQGRSG